MIYYARPDYSYSAIGWIGNRFWGWEAWRDELVWGGIGELWFVG